MNTNYEYSLLGSMSQRLNVANIRMQAVRSFNLAYNRGRLTRFVVKILGKQNHLQILSSPPVSSHHPTNRIVAIPIRQIKGSLGRSEDFDANFNPLHERIRSRWISILTAIQMGTPLPAVELVQDGDIYYVSDGHHRISVAKAIQQETIDARIVN
jgi:uncharacterized ParB-like nuclease family protein